MNICIFEDDKYRNLFPLALSRPVFELRTGTQTIREKISRYFPNDRIFLIARDYLMDVLKESTENVSFSIPAEPAVFINGRIIPDEPLMHSISQLNNGELLFTDSVLIAARVPDGNEFCKKLQEGDFGEFARKEILAITIVHLWDLIQLNGEEINKEFALFGNTIKSEIDAYILNRNQVYIANDVHIMPQVVIDATDGPVIIDAGTTVMPHSYLKGPLYIGKQCLIKANAIIYGPTSVGDVCKIGGEVAESIFQGFANKQHGGFLGHSYIGEWVNIGAGTNNSDLKNNYKEVTVFINNEPVLTGLTNFGTLIGDHSKTAINTSINTGTVIGFSVNIFGEGFPPKFVPSFSWGGRRKFSEHKFADAVETAERVMKRRNVKFTKTYKKMMETIFNHTKKMRHHGT